MPTFGDMKAAIADSIDDTTGEYEQQIGDAILKAIRFCERLPFYFNDRLGSRRFPLLANDGDSNAWTTEAYDMIYARGKYNLAKDTLKDPDVAAEALNDYGEQKSALDADTSRRRSTGFVVPTCF